MASVAGRARAKGGAGGWAAAPLSGHLGTDCWTLLLALISFHQVCQPDFLTVMAELNQTGKASLRRPCRPKLGSHAGLLALVAEVLSSLGERPLGWQPASGALERLLVDDSSKYSAF